MGERLNVYTKDGDLVKTGDRKSLIEEIKEYSYANGDAPFAVEVFHLMLINPKGELYITKRGNKTENAFLFDTTAGGHVMAGELYVPSLIRESLEEVDVDVVLTDHMNYCAVVKATDLTKKAVVRLIDFDPWGLSVRTVKKGKPFRKRGRIATYAGMYDGPVNFKDGEALESMLVKLDKLEKKIKKNPGKFTFDLDYLIKNFSYFFKPV